MYYKEINQNGNVCIFEKVGDTTNLVAEIGSETSVFEDDQKLADIFLTAIQKDKEGFFDITQVSRDDLKQAGYDGSKIDDDTMRELASKMADDYCEQLFWGSLPIIAGILNIPKLPESDDFYSEDPID